MHTHTHTTYAHTRTHTHTHAHTRTHTHIHAHQQIMSPCPASAPFQHTGAPQPSVNLRAPGLSETPGLTSPTSASGPECPAQTSRLYNTCTISRFQAPKDPALPEPINLQQALAPCLSCASRPHRASVRSPGCLNSPTQCQPLGPSLQTIPALYHAPKQAGPGIFALSLTDGTNYFEVVLRR